MHHCGTCRVLAHHTYTTLQPAFSKSTRYVCGTVWWIMQQEWLSSAAIALVWYYASYNATTRRPGVEMMSVILLQPVVMSTERSTDRPCARDMCNIARSFTHESNTCVIRRLMFLYLGLIDLLSCTRSLLPSTTSHQRILICPRTSKSWDCSEISWGFPNDCAAGWRLGNQGCSKKSPKNIDWWLLLLL